MERGKEEDIWETVGRFRRTHMHEILAMIV